MTVKGRLKDNSLTQAKGVLLASAPADVRTAVERPDPGLRWYMFSDFTNDPVLVYTPVYDPLHHYNGTMAGRECYHCKQWIEEGEEHDCWTTTETALTQDLSGDLQDAWERLRETAVSFGDQRIYASHKSVMFSRKSCYFFVRPKRNFLEVCVFLGRTLKAPQVRRVDRASKSKVVHVIQIRHRDEVEAPITDWLREAYELTYGLSSNADPIRANSTPKPRPRQNRVMVARKSVAAKKSRRR
jgi:uncharacterized protein DUF5655